MAIFIVFQGFKKDIFRYYLQKVKFPKDAIFLKAFFRNNGRYFHSDRASGALPAS